jgi:heat-inducible transcriptional repressor
MEPRKRAILKAVVQEFTTTAVPVGSQALVDRHFLNLSSATVRNELANLSDLGYLIQPHTSAGRIPSDHGYRYFVDFLMETEPLPNAVRAFIDDQIAGAGPEQQSLVERIAMVVANVTQNASVVSAPYGPTARVKHLDLVSLEPQAVLLILLLEGNVLRQHLLEVGAPIEQAELTRLVARMQRHLGGKDRETVGLRLKEAGEGVEAEVLSTLNALLEQYERGAETLVVHDGVRNLVKQPEFTDAFRLQEVLEVLEESRHLSALLREMIGESDLQVVIGSENSAEQLRSCTVVLTTYGPAGRLKGTLGVVGPTRMRYGQILARLKAVSRAATRRTTELTS